MIHWYHFAHDFGWLYKLITYIPMLITIQLVTIKTTLIQLWDIKINKLGYCIIQWWNKLVSWQVHEWDNYETVISYKHIIFCLLSFQIKSLIILNSKHCCKLSLLLIFKMHTTSHIVVCMQTRTEKATLNKYK